MKINIRSTTQLQRVIDKHVARVAIAGRPFGRYRFKSGFVPHGPTFGAIYAIVSRSRVPMDYRAVTAALGFPQTTFYHYPVSGRLALLADEGYLKVVGEGPLRYRFKHGAKLYAAVPIEQVPKVQRRVERAIARMLVAVEPIVQLAIDAPACLAQRVVITGHKHDHRYPTANPARNAEIVRLRLGGMSLSEIGPKFGITRERTRQIVERAVFGSKRRGVIGRPRKLDYDEANRTIRQVKAMGRYPKERKILLDVSDAILRMPQARQEKIQARATELIDEQLALDIINLDNG